jgi:hypothetical protein
MDALNTYGLPPRTSSFPFQLSFAADEKRAHAALHLGDHRN